MLENQESYWESAAAEYLKTGVLPKDERQKASVLATARKMKKERKMSEKSFSPSYKKTDADIIVSNQHTKIIFDPANFYNLEILFRETVIATAQIQDTFWSFSNEEFETVAKAEPTKLIETLEKIIVGEISVRVRENICGGLDDEMKVDFHKSVKDAIGEYQEEIQFGEMNDH